MTNIYSKKDLKTIVNLIKEEKVVAFPTETVFGLGVKFNSEIALNRLKDAKNRDETKAITLMVSSKEDIKKYAYINQQAQLIIDQFMPGMITMVFQKKENVPLSMTNGKETIGIRIPDDEFVLSLLREAGPMLVTSANLSNHPNTTSTQEVLDQLSGRIAGVVDGTTQDSIASTVVDVSQGVKVLREGKITLKDIEEVIHENSSCM